MNYKHFFATSLMLAVAACGPAKDRFVVDGTVADLSDEITNPTVIVKVGETTDTVAVVDGKFHYEGAADPTIVSYMILNYTDKAKNDRSHVASFVAEGGKKLTAVLADSSYVNGSPLTDSVNSFNDEIEGVYMSYVDSLKAAYQSGDEAKYDSIHAECSAAMKDVCMAAFKANTNNAVGYLAIANMSGDMTDEELEDAIAVLDTASKSYKIADQELAGRKALANTSEGKMFVDFAGKKLDGTPVKLSDYVGKGDYVLIDFWASWCGPCKAAMPELRETFLKYGPKGLKVIGVNVWERNEENGPKCVKDMDMIWDIILSTDNTPTELYGVTGIPTAVIFGPDGTIVKRGHPMEIKPSEYFAEIYK